MTRAEAGEPGSALRYQRAGSALDEHLSTCGLCQAGASCGEGDDTAEAEYRAFRSWYSEDPSAARTTYRRPR